MNYKYKASETFWRNFYALSPEMKEATRTAWALFKVDPFNPALKPHKIHALSGRANRLIYSVTVANDLRVIFTVDGSTVYTIDIGSHDIYR